jgi:streptomycin 6-kinase
VRLLAHDPDEGTLVIERCVPGAQLGREYDDRALELATSLMRRLWRAPSDDVPWKRMDALLDQWLVEIPERYERHGSPFERRLLDEALDAMRTLLRSQEDVVLCHQDLHGGNILSAEREPWLSIDARPIVAEPAYDTVAIVRDAPPGQLGVADVRRRLDVFSELLGFDRERMRLWGVVHEVAWGLGEVYNPEDIEKAWVFSRARTLG